jgi:uncharacterized protein YcnI
MSASPRRRLLRAATVTAIVAGTALAAAAPALAHVTANTTEATQGGYAVVTMRVPNESETAGTVRLDVTIPADHPITSVRVSPVPGWTATLTKAPIVPPLERNGRTYAESVGTITWTAQPGVRINPGEFTEFPISLGPLPTDVDALTLPATQTYDSGEVVAWAQPPNPDGSEPERPAPTVALAPATGDEHAGMAAAAAPAAPAAPPAAEVDTTARWLGGTGLLLGALGLGLGGGALLRTRRQVPAATTDTDEKAEVRA